MISISPLLFIFCITCFGHATGFLPLNPFLGISASFSCKGYPLIGKFLNKMASCSVCQCHFLGLVHLLFSGALFTTPWLYIVLLSLSFLTTIGISLLRLVYDLLVKVISKVYELL